MTSEKFNISQRLSRQGWVDMLSTEVIISVRVNGGIFAEIEYY
jgi:hypothetical protein